MSTNPNIWQSSIQVTKAITCGCGCGEPPTDGRENMARILGISLRIATALERQANKIGPHRAEAETLLATWNETEKLFTEFVHDPDWEDRKINPPIWWGDGPPTLAWLESWRRRVAAIT